MVAITPSGISRQIRIIITNCGDRENEMEWRLWNQMSSVPEPALPDYPLCNLLITLTHQSGSVAVPASEEAGRHWWTAGTRYIRLRATCVQVSSQTHETWGRCLNVRTFQILSTKAHSILFCNPVAKAFAKQIACCCLEPPYKELCTWPLGSCPLHFSGKPWASLPFSLYMIWELP